MVLGHLSYEDMLALRSTCKEMKEYVDAKRFTKLNLFVRKSPYQQRLLHSKESVGYPQSYRSDNPAALFASNRFRDRFAAVQRMVIYSRKAWNSQGAAIEFDLNSLNYFRALNHLEIDQMHRIDGKLNLQELRIAAFRVDDESNAPESLFNLDCPALSALRIKCCKPTLTDRIDQLDYLHYENFYGRTGYLKSISQNLRKLSTICLETIKDTLQFLTELKTGSLEMCALSEIQLEQCNPIVGLEDLANSLEDLNSDPRKPPIKFTFNGRPICSADQLRQIVCLIRAHNTEVPEVEKLNLRSLEDRSLLFLSGKPELDFLLSVACSVKLNANTELSEEMIKKLENIEYIECGARCKVSESAFELLARTCRSLRSCSLHHQKVTELLLETMSNHLVNLECIRIYKGKNAKKKEISLKHLADFQNLTCFSSDFVPEKEELWFIYANSRTLENVNMAGKDSIKLQRTSTASNAVHRLQIGSDLSFEFDSLHGLINYFYLWRSLDRKGNL